MTTLDALEPFLAREELRRDIWARHHAVEVHRVSGVHYSGTEPSSWSEPTDAEIRARAAAEQARAAAWAQSPRGRFLEALRGLEDGGGYAAEVDKVRSAYSRGFASPDRPASPKEVGVALAIIAPINTHDARMAIEAIGLILGERGAA